MKSNLERYFDLEGKSALITGAAGHLGASMSWALASAGCHVYLNGRNRQKLKELNEQIVSSGMKSEILDFDILDQNAVNNIASKLQATGLDILLNNAYHGASGSTETAERKNFEDSFGIAVTSSFGLTKALLPALKLCSKRNGYASVINIGSMYGFLSPDLRIYDSKETANPPFYGVAKAGLLQLTRYQAVEFAPFNIRVNSISPGPFPNVVTQKDNPDFINRLRSKTPMNRIGHPDELGGAVIFLGSQASSYVTGHNLVVDGGWSIW